METTCFQEKQYFRELAFFILLGILQVLFFWGMISQVFLGRPWGTKPSGDNILIIINIGTAAIILLFFTISIKTEIDKNSIRFQMFPFHLKKRFISWNEIETIKVCEYNGIKEYLGFGLRYFPGKGWCYTISGNYGLKIILKNNKKILIGTHKPKELAVLIEAIKNES